MQLSFIKSLSIDGLRTARFDREDALSVRAHARFAKHKTSSSNT
jgi:hypothetical protein